MRVLMLGGTAEARALAAALVAGGHEVTSSLAGRVSRPRLPVGRVRVGGFGGVDGLAAYLRGEGVDRLVDATHPFATTMTSHAAAAAALAGVPALRLARPGWASRPDAGCWRWAGDHAEAARVASGTGDCPFLTTGRQTLGTYAAEPAWQGSAALVRVVEPLGAGDVTLPLRWRVLQDRGPFDEAGERALMQEHGVDVLVTKDSGGAYTAAKLDAAAALGVPVVVIRRPAAPSGLTEVASVEEVLAWLSAG